MGVTRLPVAPGVRAEELVAAARDAVAAGLAGGTTGLSSARLGELVADLAALESQVAAWRLEAAAEADRRGVAGESAETGTDAWLARLTGDPREVMRGGLWLAKLLREKYDATRLALAQGRLRIEQARVIVAAAERAPRGVTPDQLRLAEESLVATATGEGRRSGRPLDARRLRQEARRMFAVVDPGLADAHEAAELRREERSAEAETWLILHDNGDGSWSGRFRIPELHGRLLRTQLERLTSPRRLSRDKAGRPVEDDTLPGAGLILNTYETHGMAFLELLEHLPTRGHAANAVTLLVHLDFDQLVSQLGSARLDAGVRISPAEARRLACEAGIVPVVLGGGSVPLDLGRTRRLHDARQRQALSVLHDTCAVAGCQRPFAWTEIHHPHWWSEGGRTDLDNALPLCGFHHRRAHDDRWDLRRHPTGDWRFHRRP